MLKSYIEYFSYFFRRLQSMFLQPSVTVKFPEVVKPLPALSHTSLRNDFSECTGCRTCETICPVATIAIEGEKYSSYIRRPTTSKGIPFELEVESFRIDYNKCVLCGLCVQQCPTGSLSFSKNFLKPHGKSKNLLVDLVHVPRSMRRERTNEL